MGEGDRDTDEDCGTLGGMRQAKDDFYKGAGDRMRAEAWKERRAERISNKEQQMDRY